jgi:hypothetical protein
LKAVGMFVAVPLLCACSKLNSSEQLALKSVSVRGTSFEVVTADGRTLHSADLAGAVVGIRLGRSLAKIRIDGVASDSGHANSVLLYTLSIQQPSGSWGRLCRAAPDGTTGGFPLAGFWSADGSLLPAQHGEIEIVCAAGAQGKCVRLGYQPWETLPDGSSILSLFNACVRMMRADYSGKGVPTTRDGTRIAISDRFGINRTPLRHPFDFEAGWDEHGAVCVHHPRIRQNITLKQIEQSSARLKGQTGKICDREHAEALGGLIFNGSRA